MPALPAPEGMGRHRAGRGSQPPTGLTASLSTSVRLSWEVYKARGLRRRTPQSSPPSQLATGMALFPLSSLAEVCRV